MERLVRINEAIINKGKPDKFALQRVLKDAGTAYEYQVSGIWISGNPAQKPEGKRVVFDLDQFRSVKDAYFAWKDISALKVDNPVRPEEVIKRLVTARTSGSSLILFVPWGMRPKGAPFTEKYAMARIKDFQNKLEARRINAQVLIMPADLYATEVNRITPERAERYFEWIKEQAAKQGFIIKPWSDIRAENIEQYLERSKELSKAVLEELLSPPVLDGALDAAKRRSGYLSKKDIEKSAFAYLRERICEAEIVEAVYQPIKVSAVSKNKDNGVDRNLPRLYIIPPNLQYSWLS